MGVAEMMSLSLCCNKCLLSLIPSRTVSPREGTISTLPPCPGNFFNSDFRAALLAAKQVTGGTQEAQQSLPLKDKIKAELTRFLNFNWWI